MVNFEDTLQGKILEVEAVCLIVICAYGLWIHLKSKLVYESAKSSKRNSNVKRAKVIKAKVTKKEKERQQESRKQSSKTESRAQKVPPMMFHVSHAGKSLRIRHIDDVKNAQCHKLEVRR